MLANILAVYFFLLLGRRVKARYCNVASFSSCQRGQWPPGLSVTVSLSTETLTPPLGAGGDAQIALATSARQELSSCTSWQRGGGLHGPKEQTQVSTGSRAVWKQPKGGEDAPKMCRAVSAVGAADFNPGDDGRLLPL